MVKEGYCPLKSRVICANDSIDYDWRICVTNLFSSLQASVLYLYPLRFPYIHTTWISRSSDVETNVSTSFQLEIHVVFLYVSWCLRPYGKGTLARNGLTMPGKTDILNLICDSYPASIYLLKVNSRNTRTRCDMFKVNNNWCRYC